MSNGRSDRKTRLTEGRTGSWATSSQDYMRHAVMLFEHSALYAHSIDGNCSPYTISGLPILFSALRALLIEANGGLFGRGRDENSLKKLSENLSDVRFVVGRYRLSTEAASHLSVLYEARNEIIHPAHMPVGSPHGTPDGMLRLRELRLLQSTNLEDSDYVWISQLQSHRLFRWAFSIIEDTAAVILREHHACEDDCISHLQSYARYRDYDL